MMVESIELDESLVNEAMTISGVNTKKAAIHIALQEFIKANHRKKILQYKGKNIWEGNLDEMRTMR
jgi:Arc/MetJ family transcription regulator